MFERMRDWYDTPAYFAVFKIEAANLQRLARNTRFSYEKRQTLSLSNSVQTVICLL